MCYVFPVIGAAVTSTLWHKTRDVKIGWLNLLFCGGAIFGITDHLWNGELFFISKNIVSDLWLGATITAVILIIWNVMVLAGKETLLVRSPVRCAVGKNI